MHKLAGKRGKHCHYPLTLSLQKFLFRDRESVRAFHQNVYLIYLPVCESLFAAHHYSVV